MRVIVQSKSLPITEAIRSYAEGQVARLVRKSKRITRVIFHIEKIVGKKNDLDSSQVTCRIQVPGKEIVITRSATDLYEAIVDTSRRAARQLRKFREKRIDKRRRLERVKVDWSLMLGDDSLAGV